MKKGIVIMTIIMGIFICTLLGIFIGRMTGDGTIQIHTRNSVRSELIDEDDTVTPIYININTATSEELQELPGIGATTAEAIVEYREEKGPFKSKKDLLKVKGIGEKTYEEIKTMITIKDND